MEEHEAKEYREAERILFLAGFTPEQIKLILLTVPDKFFTPTEFANHVVKEAKLKPLDISQIAEHIPFNPQYYVG